MADPRGTAGTRLLLFGVRGRRFACELSAVREIVPFGRITRLPGAPPAVAGVTNVRGLVITVLDLGLRLADGPVDRTEGAVLLLEHAGKLLGAGVDDLRDVVMPDDGVQPAPDEGSGDAAGVVCGVVTTTDGVAVVLDPAALVRETLVVAGGDQ
ncbi:MAG: chemotaxis protein CheW [Gemmatimonadaceae bacterium]|jgi:purine-binding chemotaxis protein CheW|nr:chemotaxis protein CheW [Gemmatimonadaceae bacterium]